MAKLKKTLLKEARLELRYWQTQTRLEARWLAASREKCKEIGKRMRAIQNGSAPG